MLRRYLIVNSVTTAIGYAGYLALVPSGAGMAAQMRDSIKSYSMEQPILAPLVYRIVTVGGRW